MASTSLRVAFAAPSGGLEMVILPPSAIGPVVLFDHFGPLAFGAGKGLDGPCSIGNGAICAYAGKLGGERRQVETGEGLGEDAEPDVADNDVVAGALTHALDTVLQIVDHVENPREYIAERPNNLI